ncbi:MAG TPA: AAA family ATPase [Planctomycetota bacterium]|nr:AAA family ATPase [Planctomycetota bacterium]
MYEAFYGFERPPFANVPDTSFFFPSSAHVEALAQLTYAVEARKGFAVLTGEVGAGKTTLTRALLRKLDPRTVTATVTNSRLTGVQLLLAVAKEFGIEDAKPNRVELLDRINRFLIARLAEDRNVVLLIDEAQDLPLSTLEEVRLISNLETETEKLVQILLIGQPELRDSVDHPSLRQLRQRIAFRFHLKPLDQDQTREYVLHRLRVAGPLHGAKFTDKALEAVWRYSGGVPRLINLVCDKALLVGFTEDEKKIDQKTVLAGIREIEGPDWNFKSKSELAAERGATAPRRTFLRLPFFGGRTT